MSLKDEVRYGPRMWTRARVDEALGDEASDLAEVLADPAVPPHRIYQSLNARGIEVSLRPVYDWADKARRGVAG